MQKLLGLKLVINVGRSLKNLEIKTEVKDAINLEDLEL
jgi:hypothetical protein